MKGCTKCGTEKPLDDFRITGAGKPYSWCKGCERASARERYERNRSKVRAQQKAAYYAHQKARQRRQRAFRAAHLEQVRAVEKRYRRRNPEKRRASQARWRNANRDYLRMRANERYAANPAYFADQRDKRRALLRAVTYEHFPRIETYYRFNGMCQHCGLSCPITWWHQDHIIPLALGGHHTRRNVQVLCPPCNAAKGRKLDFLCRKPARPLLLPG